QLRLGPHDLLALADDPAPNPDHALYLPTASSITAGARLTWSHFRVHPGAGGANRRLDVAAGDGQVTDEDRDDDHHNHRDPSGAEAGAAQRPGPAEVVGERRAQRTGHHVGEPEGRARVGSDPPPAQRGYQ